MALDASQSRQDRGIDVRRWDWAVHLFRALSSFDPCSELRQTGWTRPPAERDPDMVSVLQTPNGRLTSAESAALVEAYQAGATARELCQEYGISRRTVRAHIHRAGIPLRSRLTFTRAEAKELVRRYLSGETGLELGKAFGCSERAIFLELRRSGVSPRSRGRVRR
jgi:DNA-binding CsgD family transcriptional regulator